MAANTESAQKAKGLDLFAAMAAVDLSAPGVEYEPVAEGEKVLGAMGDDLYRLSFVRRDMIKEHDAFRQKIEKIADDHNRAHLDGVEQNCSAFLEEFNRQRREYSAYVLKVQAIDDIFWTMLELKLGLDLNSKHDLALREGGQVVLMPETDAQVVIEFQVVPLD